MEQPSWRRSTYGVESVRLVVMARVWLYLALPMCFESLIITCKLPSIQPEQELTVNSVASLNLQSDATLNRTRALTLRVGRAESLTR